jgi:ArsR family transcriptional regulator
MIDIIKISKALSDPIRYRILVMLLNHERGELEGLCCSTPEEGVCNCDIVSTFGMLQSRVSYHMKELTNSGLVREEPRGKWKYYFLNKETIEAYIRQIKKDFKL